MSFKWECACGCGKKIIVPYKSPESMSHYSWAYCSRCFNYEIDIFEETGEFFDIEDENGNLINAYRDIDGLIFKCEDAE